MTALPALAAALVAALVAGCQNLPEFPDFSAEPQPACVPRDAAPAERSGAGRAKAEEPYSVVALDPPDVRRVQARLARLGYAPGPADGVIGRQTRDAIRRFQSANCMAPTGVVSSRLLAYMGIAAESARPPGKPDPTAPDTPAPRRPADGAPHAADTPTPHAAADRGADLAPKEFPAYEPGMTFVYSNGSVDRVSGVKDAAVKWVRNDGTTYTADPNFLLPWLSWASDDERGSTAISGAAGRLWPLRKGAEVTFSAKVTVQRRDAPDTTEQRVDRWRCRNEGPRTVAVPAGAFETLAFVCRRKRETATPEVMRTWYYAKQVRHFVRFVEIDPERNATRSVDLVAVRPGMAGWPPIVRAALARAIVRALEAPAKEARSQWTSSGVNSRVTIDALSRSRGADGRPCRRFVQIWTENGHNRHYPALACQTASGKWEIPGLENHAAGRSANPDEALLR